MMKKENLLALLMLCATGYATARIDPLLDDFSIKGDDGKVIVPSSQIEDIKKSDVLLLVDYLNKQ